MTHALDEVGRITDAELVCRVERLVKADRALVAKLILHLGEVDARQLFRERAYSSMFEYCRSGLGMSEGEAGLRILAARVGRRFPLVLERLSAGAVHLTAIKLLAPLLTQDNHVQLLDRVRGMSKRRIEVLVADLAPKPDVPARSRKLQATATAAADSTPLMTADTSSTTAVQPSASPAALPSVTFALQQLPRARATSTPLGRGRFKLQVMLGQEAQEALDQLVELFRHQNASGDLTSIVERALIELRKSKMKQRFGHTNASKQRSMAKPSSAEPDVDAKAENQASSSKSRHIPAEVRRAVHARDDGQCTYVSPDGRRCTARGFIEIHHHNTTFARGGEATVENLRLACRAHNQFLAEQDYGRAYMQQKLREARGHQASASGKLQLRTC